MFGHVLSDRLLILSLALCVSVVLGWFSSLRALLMLDAPAHVFRDVMRGMIVKLNRVERGASVLAMRGSCCMVLGMMGAYLLGSIISIVAGRFHHGLWLEVAVLFLLLPLHGIVHRVNPVLGKDAAAISLTSVRETVAKLMMKDVSHLDYHGLYRTCIEYIATMLVLRIVTPAMMYMVAGLGWALAIVVILEMWLLVREMGIESDPFGQRIKACARLVVGVFDRGSVFLVMCACISSPSAKVGAALKIAARDASILRAQVTSSSVAAFAGALHISLGGPFVLAGVPYEQGWTDAGRARVEASDVLRAVWLYRVAIIVLFVLVQCLNMIF